jgi:RNA polymerase sigma-70 factor (ECF subfamily)
MSAAKNNGEQQNISNVLDDATLLERLRAGDDAAFDVVYSTYASGLVRFAYSYVGSTAAAQDVVAETFAHLWDRHTTIDPQYGLKAYLFAAVHHRARMSLRSAGRADRFLSRFAAEPADDTPDVASLDAAIDAPQLDAALRRAIQTLPAERRRLVSLRWYEGLSVPQIAHVLGLTVGAVEQRLLRTLRTLRQVMDARL